jgi:hypothetical protein
MTVLHSGTTKKYSENWAAAFGKGGAKKAAKTKAAARKKPARKKAAFRKGARARA